jgi:hypothetical protein
MYAFMLLIFLHEELFMEIKSKWSIEHLVNVEILRALERFGILHKLRVSSS